MNGHNVNETAHMLGFDFPHHFTRTFGELLRQGMAVGTRTETGGYDNNFFHQIWLLALIRSAKLTFGLR